jgi:hypothetical protein
MTEKERFEKMLRNHPHSHKFYFQRPHWTRRHFFQVLGGALGGSFLVKEASAAANVVSTPVEMQATAKNVIFILMSGAPSHIDLFDFKEQSGTTPMADMQVESFPVFGLLPTAILPSLTQHNLGDIAVVRSVRSWALVHSLAQTWSQIGRNPAAALGSIAPNIGSIVALEKAKERKATDVFPTFLALNSGGAIGAGYLESQYAPFKTNANASGLANTTNADGEARLNERWSLLHSMDGPLREASPFGKPIEDMNGFYESARALMYNPVVNQAFRFSTADAQRYGVGGVANGFGNACLTAKQVLQANAGTRFIQITVGGWDMHQNIYGTPGNRFANGTIFSLGRQFDAGLSALINDLKQAGLLEETLIVATGEFGRTPRFNGSGRDHFPQQFALFAGGGVKGGQVLGSTDASGSVTNDPGWSRARDVRPEDIEATIYSALGINWTTIRYDDPFGRGFEYVPYAKEDVYGPVNELFKKKS